MAVDDRISFYGIGITAPAPQTSLYGIGIEQGFDEKIVSLFGIGIAADNVFNANVKVIDGTTNLPVVGATVTTVTTQTQPGNYIGNLSITTDSNGVANLKGSTTTGTTLEITKIGYQTFNSDLPINLKTGTINVAIFPEGGGGSTSKKIYTTNKGNVLINPNDTILIELD
jgi:hypothetical protein